MDNPTLIALIGPLWGARPSGVIFFFAFQQLCQAQLQRFDLDINHSFFINRCNFKVIHFKGVYYGVNTIVTMLKYHLSRLYSSFQRVALDDKFDGDFMGPNKRP
jgi:hypothetical protein